MVENPPPYIEAHPSERNILEWHYVLTGPPDTPYEGGQYHGLVIFPRDYPFKPPEIRMTTPSGRFATNTRLCLSMSDYHPDTWQPAWSVATILTGLLSFMTGTDPTTGSVTSSDETKRRYARASLEWNARSNPVFIREFPDLVEQNLKILKDRAIAEKEEAEKKIRQEREKREAAAALNSGKVDLTKLDPEDRIRYLAAQAEVNAEAARGSQSTYWTYYLFAIAIVVGFIAVVK